MMGPILLLLMGLALLAGGAELVVRRGSKLAALLGISPMVVGLTIVSIGTNVPELAVGVAAAWHGTGTLAVGNVAGTNTANILLVLGISALLAPLALDKRTFAFDLPVMVVASVGLVVLALNGTLSRPEASLLLVAAVLYTLMVARRARQERNWARWERSLDRDSRGSRSPAGRTSLARHRSRGRLHVAVQLTAVLAGIVIIIVGSNWLVQGAVELARLMDVTEAFIGLTVVAVGTSLPELTTAVVGTWRQQRDIAVGNVVGSCVYNVLLVLGASALVPSAGIPVTAELVRVDIPVMTVAALACVPVFMNGRRISRLEGACFVVAYGAYLTYLVLART